MFSDFAFRFAVNGVHRGFMDVELQAGPDAGRRIALSPGRYILGRAHSAAIRVADPALEPHHAIVEVGTHYLAVTQICGRLAMTVDGAVHAGGAVRPGVVVEVGASRIQLGTRPHERVPSGPWATLAAVEREVYLARIRAPWVVTLGWGSVRLPLPADVDQLDLPDHAARAAAELHTDLPVVADLARRHRQVLAIRGPRATDLIAAVVRQLPVVATREVVVGDPNGVPEGDHAMTILTAVEPDGELPAECHGVVELGANWRATYTPDLAEEQLEVVRLHAAGATLDEVPRARSAVGGGVVRVPDATGAERQAAAPDALAEVVAQTCEHRDLLVEAGAPRLGQAGPVGGGRCALLGQVGQRRANLVEREPDSLGGANERDSTQHVGVVPAVPRHVPLGLDQTLVLVEPKG